MAVTVKLTKEACLAGRALKGWTQGDLVREAGVSPLTVVKVERGGEVREESASRILGAFERAGVEILNGDAPGARLRSQR